MSERSGMVPLMHSPSEEEESCAGVENFSTSTCNEEFDNNRLLCRLKRNTLGRLPEFLQRRIMADFFLAKSHLIQFAFVIFIIVYVQTVWARTTAFYRHKQIDDYVTNSSYVIDHRLKDMGYEVFPDYSSSSVVLHLNEGCQYSTGVWLVLLIAYPYVYDIITYRRLLREEGPDRVSKYDPFDYSPVRSASMGARFALCLGMVELLRMPCYLVTTLPGPSSHCIGPAAAANRPKDYWEVFYQPRTGKNCGDLIFSGHISFLMTATMTATYYFPRLAKNRRYGRYFAMSTFLVIAIQIVFILMTRSHYTVDVVVGLIVGFLAWQMDQKVLRPSDRTPPGYPLAYEFTSSCKNRQTKKQYQNGEGIATGKECKMWSLVRIFDADDDDEDDEEVADINNTNTNNTEGVAQGLVEGGPPPPLLSNCGGSLPHQQPINQ